MGEAKRRKELGLPPKLNKNKKSNSNENKFSLSNFSVNNFKNQYPAAPFVTTALFLIIAQFGLSHGS